MLPLVRRIVEDAVHDYVRWQDRVREFEVASLRSSPDRPDQVATELESDAQRLAKNIEGYLREIAELGVQMKSIDNGIVDFPGELDGRPIMLCWQLGEQSVNHWHDVESGFAGRQPLVPELIPHYNFN